MLIVFIQISLLIMLAIEATRNFYIMALSDALEKSLDDVPEGVAAGYLDLKTGEILGFSAIEDKPQEFLNVVATAVSELFEAPLFKIFENMRTKNTIEEDFGENSFSEILLLGTKYITMLKRCDESPQHAVVYVAQKSTPPGILLMQVRNNLPSIESAVNSVNIS